MNKIITEIDYRGQVLTVEKKENGLYDVCINGEAKHPDGDAETVMRALSQYLHGTAYELEKLKSKNTNSSLKR